MTEYKYNPWPLGKLPQELQRPEPELIKSLGYNWNDPRDIVDMFEQEVAKFFGSPYAVAVDSCTHGIELCLRITGATEMFVPHRTYLSVPMLANKMGIELCWVDYRWEDFYSITSDIFDAAVYWEKDGYVPCAFMCLSFQYQKHLSLGRAGMILLDDRYAAKELKKMSYDGRLPGKPWRDQDVDTMGFHYYMTPEVAELGLSKLQAAIETPPRKWSSEDYPDLTNMKIFKDSI